MSEITLNTDFKKNYRVIKVHVPWYIITVTKG